MICHGDELGRTQGGNNNGYCKDNEITWVNWDEADTELLEFTRSISALRAGHPVFRRRRFFDGRPVRRRGSRGVPDISWFRPDGSEMSDEDWDSGFGKWVAVYLNGQGVPDRDVRGERVTDTRSSCASTPTTNRSNSRCHQNNSAQRGSRLSTLSPRAAYRRTTRR